MEQRIEFFDSNILIADAIQHHEHHRPSRTLLDRLRNAGGACAAHTLAETYNTLTKPSPGFAIPANAAAAIVRAAAETYTLVTLTPSEMVLAIATAAECGLAGPIIYDALLIACARKIEASVIYTHNVRHFRRVAPDLASIIREP